MPELDERAWGDEVPTFEELYDDATLRRLGLEPADRPDEPAERPGSASTAVTRAATAPGAPAVDGDRELAEARTHPVRRRVAGAMLAGAMLGLGEVLEPERSKEAAIAPELLGEPPNLEPVQFIMVPGLPKASVVLLRPWLRHPPTGADGPEITS